VLDSQTATRFARGLFVALGLMEELTLLVLIGLALMGMAGVCLVPMRLWYVVVLRRAGYPLNKSRPAFLIALLVLVPAVLAMFAASQTMPRVFFCLTDMRCGASRAGGLVNLAIFGASVLLMELCWFLAVVLWSRWYALAQPTLQADGPASGGPAA
jgi:hypothetical protein